MDGRKPPVAVHPIKFRRILKGPKMDDLVAIARRVAFLHAHISDRKDGQEMLTREIGRLYAAITAHDGNEEPDLTFCCGCREEIEPSQEQWVIGGNKYHGMRCLNAIADASPDGAYVEANHG